MSGLFVRREFVVDVVIEDDTICWCGAYGGGAGSLATRGVFAMARAIVVVGSNVYWIWRATTDVQSLRALRLAHANVHWLLRVSDRR